MSDDLMTQAQAAVKASDLPAEEIARRADVSERWIYLLKAGELTNPSIRRLERVIKAIADAPKRKRAA